jgi:hypothetical protein
MITPEINKYKTLLQREGKRILSKFTNILSSASPPNGHSGNA